MSEDENPPKEISVSIPVNGKSVPGKISWEIEVGARWRSDCGTYCVPVSLDDWRRVLNEVEPASIGISISLRF